MGSCNTGEPRRSRGLSSAPWCVSQWDQSPKASPTLSSGWMSMMCPNDASACSFPFQSYLQTKKTEAASINWTWLSPPFLWFTCFSTNDRLFGYHFILCWFFLYSNVKIKMTCGRGISRANQLLMCSVLLCFENCLPLSSLCWQVFVFELWFYFSWFDFGFQLYRNL